MAPKRRTRLVDFTYQHHTMTHGAVNFGGIESGTKDAEAAARLEAYASKHGGVVQTCKVGADHKTELEHILFVNPAGAEASSAPNCRPDGTMPFN